MEKAAAYGWFALHCGWTTQEVDSQPQVYLERLPIVAKIYEEIRAEKAKAAK